MSHHTIPEPAPAPIPGLWLDTDLALGAPAGDVDDGFALAAAVLAARQGGPRLLGVSAVSGNTDGVTAHRAIRSLLEVLCSDAPAVSESEAPGALLRLPPGASVVAIGPPSNLVRAARQDPGFPGRVEVRVVGRVLRRLRHPVLPFLDLNFRTDPVATRAFWALPWRAVRVFPLDVVGDLRCEGRDLEWLEATGVAGAYLARHSRRWLRRALFVHLARSFPIWDLPAALDAVGLLPGSVWGEGQPAWLRRLDVARARKAFFGLFAA